MALDQSTVVGEQLVVLVTERREVLAEERSVSLRLLRASLRATQSGDWQCEQIRRLRRLGKQGRRDRRMRARRSVLAQLRVR